MLGSFFNVVVVRLPKMMELAWQRDCAEASGKPMATQPAFNLAVPASHCPTCHAPVRAWDNIPLLSFLVLRGRCRHCHTPIHWRYPVLELVSALIPVACLLAFGLNAEALGYTLLLWFLLVLSSIDLDHMLLPDQLTLPLLWLGLLGAISILPVSPTDAIIGAVAGYLFLWSLYWVFKLLTGKDGLGYGDFKLLAALGAWLGWQMLPLIILLGSLSGAVIGIAMMVIKRQQQGAPIPFGPFLALGGVIALFAGDLLYQWYWQWAGWA
ncbi:MAG: prepilin peptidase [Idiomarina sp.]|nr:prepilin peptidase [Idiomarina sp.]